MKNSRSHINCIPKAFLNSGVKFFLLLGFVLGGNWGWGQACNPAISTTGSQTILNFNNVGTCIWTVPAGVTAIQVEAWGGGGGGGGGSRGGGGGGGGFAGRGSYAVVPGEQFEIIVGIGGGGGTTDAGVSGGFSHIRKIFNADGTAVNTVVIRANGGGTGSSNSSGSGGSCSTGCTVGNNGGNGGASGTSGTSGSGGGAGNWNSVWTSTTCNSANNYSGCPGNGKDGSKSTTGGAAGTLETGSPSTGGGGNGGGGASSSGSGGSGIAYGGGGGGRNSSGSGGSGGRGHVRITYTATLVPTISSFTPSTVCASSSATVTITGANFTGATAVSFGGTAATAFTVNSATQITATVGAGTTGNVSVTTPGGTVISSGTLTVNTLASPGTFQYANTSTQTICAGSTISCTNTTSPMAGSGSLSIVWYCGELNAGGVVGGNYATQYGNWRESTLSNVSGTTSSINLNAAAGGGAGMSSSLTDYNPQLDFPGKTNFVIIRRAYNSNCGVCVGGCQDQYFYLNLTTVTAAPTIATPLCSGATTITGTSANNASVIVTVNGVAQTAVNADASGNWSRSVPALTAGHIVTATAQVAGQCVSNSSSQVTVSATPTAASVVSATLNVCGSLTSGSLGGNTPSTGTGAWSIVSGGTGSFSAINSGSSTFTANAFGTYVLRWTVSNSPCASSSADVTVTFSTQPILWANTQSPASGVSCSNDNFNVYGQVYIPGVTEGATQGANVTAQLGYSTTNTDPSTWTNWVNATYNSAVTGNNYEYIGTLSGLAGNTYYYAFRYSYNGCAYVYGGYSAPSAPSNTWTVNTNGGSAFVGNSTTNGGGSSGGINSSNGVAFGLYNNSGTTTEAIRNFPSLLVGQTVRFDMDNGWINNGNSVGVGLQNASGQNVWEIYFSGGALSYVINAGSVSPAVNIPFTVNGLRINFTLTSATTYSATIQILNGGATYGPYTGTLLSPGGGQSITRFRAFNFNAGGDGNYNFYFNNIVTPSFFDNASTYSTWSNGTQSTTSVGGIWNSPTTIGNGTLTVTTAPTTASAGSTQTICEGTSATLAANAPSPSTATGAWTITSGPNNDLAQFNDASSNVAVFTPTLPGTYVLRWTITNGSCSSFSEVTINVTSGILDFVNTQFPGSAAICVGQSANVYGQVFEPGVTPNTGQGANIEVQVGYVNSSNTDPPNSNSWTNWSNATYNTAVTGNNDEYIGTFGSALSAGTYYYAFRYRLNGCAWQYGGYSIGGGGTWNGTNNISGVLTIYGNTSTAMTPSSICAGVSNIAVTGSNAGSYELLVNGVSQGVPSTTNSWTIPGPLVASDQVCVRGYAATNLITMDGALNEAFWSPALVNSAGGATSGTGNRINALYVKNAHGFLNIGIAGRLVAGEDRKILLFVDSKNGGHNSLSTWTNRSGVSQNNGLKNLNGGMQFDPGFTADYAISIGTNSSGESFLDFYDMVTNTNNYLGSTITQPTRIAYQANTNATDYTKGYEIRIPINLFGTITSPMKFFAMLTNNPTDISATTLSNQFLSPASNGQGDYGDGPVNFGNAAPNPVSYVLESDCYNDVCRTVVAPTTPTFTQLAPICSGASLSALPTTSNNGITGTWSPALDNTQTTTYTFTPTAGLCANTAQMTITVNPTPSVIANSNSPICAGQAINLTATDGFSTYAWSGPNSFSNATQNPSISNAQAVNAGTYTLTVTDGNGCQATSSTVVSLTTSPTAGNNGPVCVGGALSLSTNSATSYSWSGPNSFTSNLQNPTVSASATTAMAGTYTVSVVGSCAAATGVVDNFSDGNFTANPVWTSELGGWQVSSGYLRGDNTVTVDKIRTPSTQVYGTWNFDFQFQTTSGTTGQVVRVFPIATLTTLNSGYYVFADGSGTFQFRRLDAGTPTTLINSTWSPNLQWHTVKVIREFDNTFKLYLDGILKGTSVADATYLTSSFFGIWNSGTAATDNHYIDNISCSPPSTATTLVTVNTSPSVSAKSGTICSGSTYTMSTAAPDVVPGGTTYSWTFTSNPNITGATTGTTQGAFTQTLTNTSSLPQTIVYSVTPSSGGCAGTAFTVTITVKPALNGGTISTDQTICSGATPTTLTNTQMPSGGNGLGLANSVVIGTQIWMIRNLDVVNYNDGTTVGTDFTGTAGAYTWYNNSYPTWGQYYGPLYNWYAVNTGNLCPVGWHVPTRSEWNTLINYVGNTLNAGKKLKSCRTVTYGCPTTLDPRWDADNTAFGTDDYGFAILPAGRAFISNGILNFERVRSRTRFWASTQNDVSNGDTYEFNDNSSGVNVFNHPKNEGYSVRCMGDNANTILNSYTYQWQQSVGCNNVWTDIPLANGSTYSPGALTQTTCFRRMITDACGTAYSNTITITVNPAPAITAMTATICSGATFTATPVNGTNGTVPAGTTYTWSAPSISPANAITGGSAQAVAQTSVSQTLTNVTTANATATYTVTPTVGSCPGASFTVTVTVLPPFTTGTVQGITSAGTATNVVISQIYGGGGNTYRYDFIEIFNPTSLSQAIGGYSIQYQTQGNSTWSILATIPSGVNLLPGQYFLIHVNDGATGAVVTADLTAPTSTNISNSQGKMALVSNNAVLTSCTQGTIVDKVGYGTTSVVCNETSNAPAPSNTNAIWRVSNGCIDNNNNSTDFSTASPAPRNTNSFNYCFTNTQTICAGQTASSITATAASGANGSFSYQWYSQAGNVSCPTGSSTVGWTPLAGETNLTLSPGVVSATTTYALFVTATGANNCGGAWATDCRKVIVNPVPIVTDMITTVCSGTAFSVTPANGTNGTVPAGTTYSWAAPSVPGITGTAAGTSASSISGTLTNTTNAPITVSYTVTPVAGSCTGTTFTVSVTVNPTPTVTNMTAVTCSGTAVTVTPTNGTNGNIPSGTTFTWGAPTQTGVSGGTAGSGTSLTASLTGNGTAVYIFSPTNGSCLGSGFTVTISVEPCLPFTSCNLVVYRVGDGNIASTNSAAPVSIQEITASGNIVQTISAPFTGSTLLNQNFTAASVGLLNSFNGHLSVPGYSVSSGTALDITSPINADLINKVNSILDANGVVQSYTSFPTSAPIPFSGDHLRGTIPISATNFYATGAGGNQGVYYYNGSSFNQLVSANARGLEIFNNQLYYSSSSNVFQVGTGLPTSGTQITNGLLTTYSNPGIYGFSISPDGCTMYVADNGSNSSYRGVSKYKLVSGAWTYQYNYQTWGIGLVVDYSGSNDVIYVTTAINGSNAPNKIEKLIDNPTGNNFTVVTTGWPIIAPSNYRFAGIDFTPNSTSATISNTNNVSAQNSTVCQNGTATTLTVASATSSNALTYQWYSNTSNDLCGATAISGATGATYSPPTTSPGTTYYFAKISSNCATVTYSSIATVIVNPNPTPNITGNAPLCSGSSITLTANPSGQSYVWSPGGQTTQTISVTSADNYSVTVTDSNNCSAQSTTATVSIITSPSVIFLSPP